VIKGEATLPQWSPDGKKLLYQVVEANGTNIWVANADGSNKLALTHGGSNGDAAWSPAH